MNVTAFSRFGVTFKPLSDKDLEMVRIWRNSDDVRPFMQYQEIITSGQQETWFRNLNKENNFYFVAIHNDEPFGVYNIKDIDFAIGGGEPGVYLKTRELWEGDIAMRGSLAIILFAFESLGLNFLISHVLKTNTKVLAYNKQMGFRIHPDTRSEISHELILKKEDFYLNVKVARLIRYLEKE